MACGAFKMFVLINSGDIPYQGIVHCSRLTKLDFMREVPLKSKIASIILMPSFLPYLCLFLFVCSAVSFSRLFDKFPYLYSFDEWQWYLAATNAFYTPKRIPLSGRMERLYSPGGSLGVWGSSLLVR